MKICKYLVPIGLLLIPVVGHTQEGLVPTQALVRAESKQGTVPTAASITVKVENKPTTLTGVAPVPASAVQVALLIDDGLSRSAGVQLNDLQDFVRALPAGSEVLIGYMSNGRVEVVAPFTPDHASAAEKIRLPIGFQGQSASPYFCLSDFVKRWPIARTGSTGKARLVMMITNGVDPYNGSTELSNQNSPYVQSAIDDALRAGVSVSSIYYRDAGFRGSDASFSGQGYLKEVADATGGEAYYEGTGSPVSLKPYLESFTRGLAETYVLSFNAGALRGGRGHLVRLTVNTSLPKLKLRHPEEVRPGNVEGAP